MNLVVKSGFVELPRFNMNEYLRSFLIPGGLRVNVYSNTHNDELTVCVNLKKRNKQYVWKRYWKAEQVEHFLKEPHKFLPKEAYGKKPSM